MVENEEYDVEKHYDKIAAAYEKFEGYNPRKHVLIKESFIGAFPKLSGLSVLDLGCGAGFFAQLIKSWGQDASSASTCRKNR